VIDGFHVSRRTTREGDRLLSESVSRYLSSSYCVRVYPVGGEFLTGPRVDRSSSDEGTVLVLICFFV
jgi:hypothetical protein